MSFAWILIDFYVAFQFSEILQLQGMTFVDRFRFFGGFLLPARTLGYGRGEMWWRR